jgi:hypothetical protein
MYDGDNAPMAHKNRVKQEVVEACYSIQIRISSSSSLISVAGAE